MKNKLKKSLIVIKSKKMYNVEKKYFVIYKKFKHII